MTQNANFKEGEKRFAFKFRMEEGRWVSGKGGRGEFKGGECKNFYKLLQDSQSAGGTLHVSGTQAHTPSHTLTQSKLKSLNIETFALLLLHLLTPNNPYTLSQPHSVHSSTYSS